MLLVGSHMPWMTRGDAFGNDDAWSRIRASYSVRRGFLVGCIIAYYLFGSPRSVRYSTDMKSGTGRAARARPLAPMITGRNALSSDT